MRLNFSLSSTSDIQKILQHAVPQNIKVQDLHFSEDGSSHFENDLSVAITFTSTKAPEELSLVVEVKNE